MVLGAGITTVWVLIRSIYRTIELVNGWTGNVITNQVYFNVFDGAPIVLAMVTLNLFHPGWLCVNRTVLNPIVFRSTLMIAMV